MFDNFLKTNKYLSNIIDDDYLFEGNFVRNINRLINLLNEIKYLADNTRNINLLSKINNCIIKLEDNKWFKNSSLYLRLSNNDF